jgi:peptide/nickel transport system substrate-binding protein
MFKGKKKNQPTPQKIAQTIAEKAVSAQTSTTKHFRKYFSRRAARVGGVRRFVIGWLALVIGLCVTSSYGAFSLYSKSRVNAPADGGIFNEGLVGRVNNLNPIFSSGNVDGEASQLMFNGLVKYGDSGEIEPDLAKSWQISNNGLTYTFTLRDDVKWQDGVKFSAKDVEFTYKTIQNKDVRSPLFSSWQDKQIKAQGKNKVKFTLPNASAPFLNALTIPIIPSHILDSVSPKAMRTATFNNSPVGTGPFQFRYLRKTNKGQQLELSAYKEYFKAKPRLEKFIISAYNNEEDLLKDLDHREITAAVDLSSDSASRLENNNNIRTIQYPVLNGVFAFFKTSKPPLNDINVRRSLVAGFDRQAILDIFNARYLPLKTPFLSTQPGYSSASAQQTNIKKAAKLLDNAGWKLKNGVRTKGSKKLEIKLVSRDTAEYVSVSSELQKQWSALGITVKPELLSQEEFYQIAINGHDYDVLLAGIEIGSDPDIFAYWHSSQARAGLRNFSEWNSPTADINLETARSRLQLSLRKARNEAFSKEWSAQAPALALYQPYMNYSYHQSADGFKIFPLNTASDRLANVQEWTADTRSVYLTP